MPRKMVVPPQWKNHPEARPDEVFITNASDDVWDFTDDPRSSWEVIGWKSKRRGTTAYDMSGRVIPEMFPVFVRRDELENAGVDPDSIISESFM